MSKPSVLLINRVYPPVRGATGRIMQDLASALSQNGWRVTVLSVSQDCQIEDKEFILNEFVVSNIKPKGVFGYSWLLMRLCIKGLRLPKHDVVITMTDPPMLVIAGRLISKFKKSKHVHWVQDLYPDLLPIIKVKLPNFIQNRLLSSSLKGMKKADRVVAIGECMAKLLQKKKIDPAKIIYIPNWADFEVISPTATRNYLKLPEKITAIAKKPEDMFRDDSPKFRVLYAGSIGRAHPMMVIIEAAEILSRHKEIEFTFIGDHHAHSIMAKERAKRGLDNIKFIPFQPIEKLKSIMETGDLHLVTMRDEAQGMLVPCKFYSGLTVGRPTIFAGPQQCEVADVLRHYGAGLTVSPMDGKALAAAIYQYRVDGDLWFKGQEGALLAAQAYHPNKPLQAWVDMLEGMHKI